MKISNKQKAKNAIKWIEALLSGNYTQNREGELGSPSKGFCCWGLGCFIVDMPFNSWETWEDDLVKYTGFLDENGRINPPYIYNKEEIVHISTLNDKTTADFKDIANYLIEHCETNFEDYVAEEIKNHFH